LRHDKAPSFRLTDLEGNVHTLEAYRGKIVWLEFWVTWCSACLETLAKKDVLYRSLRHPDLVFLTIHVTGREADPFRIFRFMEESGFKFPVLRDEGRRTYDAFGLSSVPASVIIGRDGTIHGIYDETVTLTAVIAEVGKLLSARA
jgi:peroxiredoxin